MAPRVLFVSYTSDWTGPTNSLLNLLCQLRDRFDCTVMMPAGGEYPGILEKEGIPSVELPSLRKRDLLKMMRVIRKGRFNLVYGNNRSSSSENALIAAKLCGLPFVSHVREMGWKQGWRHLAYLRFADAVIPVSQACANSHSRVTRKGSVHVVHNGLSIEDWEVDRERARQSLGRLLDLPQEALIAITVGHVVPRKGHDHAVRIMRTVVDQDPNVHLAILGDLERRPGCARKVSGLIRSLDISGNVHLLGFRQDVPTLLPGGDLYLHTAVEEPHPRSVLEAMASGLPVLAFATDGVSESVVDGETGYLVPTGDLGGAAQALLRIAEDPALRESLGSAARERVKNRFRAAETARKVADVIDLVLARCGPRLFKPS